MYKRQKEDPTGGWTQDQFILDEAGEAICSRMTLYKLEQGQGIQDEERLELLLRKLGETPLKQPEQVCLRKERIQRLKQAYEQLDQKALSELLTDIEALPPTTQVIAMEPVSYTHLDVYKRQKILRSDCLPYYFRRNGDLLTWIQSRAIDGDRVHSRLLKKALQLQRKDELSATIDVYKRQC